MGPMRVFPKHPLAYDTREAQHRAAKTMLSNTGRVVAAVWLVEHDCIAYTNLGGEPLTARIERDDKDTGWTIAGGIAAGWPVPDTKER